MRQTNRKEKDRCQHRIDKRDHDLCAHNRGEAAIKIAESRRNLVAADGEAAVLHAMSAAVTAEACINKEAAGCDNPKQAQNQYRRRASTKVHYDSQLIR